MARGRQLPTVEAETYLAERVEQFFEQTAVMFGEEETWERAFIQFLTERREEINDDGL